MPFDYQALRDENTRRYGTDIGRIGGMLLADRYDKRTHFIFELLQNAEDALRRRNTAPASKTVSFDLTNRALSIRHFGQPFDDADVAGVCGIAQSTKGSNEIGRFGIGFKSVYAVTDRPEIHSGAHQFAIENYVLPVSSQAVERAIDQTHIVLPFRPNDSTVNADIASGLAELDPTTLLFLRQIEEISWSVQGGQSGLLLRSEEPWRDGARRVTLMCSHNQREATYEQWLIFSRSLHHNSQPVGHVEIAFALNDAGLIKRSEESPLVVFFPTVLSTHTGFLLQGPFKTTPSRDNLTTDDEWNRHVIGEAAALLCDVLHSLKHVDLLDIGVLRCLPIERSKFSGKFFEPLFERVLAVLHKEPLLPTSTSQFASAAQCRLARTQELRDLLSPAELGSLLNERAEVHWLSAEITADRASELRHYLMRELRIVELTPETIMGRLTKPFLEARSDEWLVKLYAFIAKQPALHPAARTAPLIRLTNGEHVPAFIGSTPQAFLPGEQDSGFPTVRESTCRPAAALALLRGLGLTEPDPVEDIIRHVLPRYASPRSVDDATYARDFEKVMSAYRTDSQVQRARLVAQLRNATIVRTRDAKSNIPHYTTPGNAYLPTARLQELFSGVGGVQFVDTQKFAFLRGEACREMLEACGAVRHLAVLQRPFSLDAEQRRALRREHGAEYFSRETETVDQDVRGLEGLLGLIRRLPASDRHRRSALLWEALLELLDRRGEGVFSAKYEWMYYATYRAEVEAHFIRRLNDTAWVADANGHLHKPSDILFEPLGWRESPFVQSIIRFRAPAVEALAREVGIEVEVLDVLKSMGLTNAADLRARLGLVDNPPTDSSDQDQTDTEGMAAAERTASVSDSFDAKDDAILEPEVREGGAPSSSDDDNNNNTNTSSRAQRAHQRFGSRQFISYVAVEPEGHSTSESESEQADRMQLEDKAIEFILRRESHLRRTQTGNAGFDLIDEDADGNPERWIEVKAMSGSLDERPVGLSSVQFEFARQHGEQYWLYIVEHADDDEHATLLKICNPAGIAGTFTFDRGWRAVAVE